MKHPRTGEDLPEYAYETDENPKKKHRWGNVWAGFVRTRGAIVSKCPSTISNIDAERSLNDGVPWLNPRRDDQHPSRIYAVRDGVVYRAVPTRRGVSYHGFPELPNELRGLPKALREQILEMARRLGQESEVRAWIEQEPEIEER